MTDDNRQAVPDRAEPVATKRHRSRLRRWLIPAVAVALLAMGTLGIAGKVYMQRVEARALRLAQTGTSIDAFLKNYVDLLQARDIPALVSLFDTSGAGDRDGPWEEQLRSDRDDVQVFSWTARVSGPLSRDGLRRQVREHLDRIGAIESGRFPIVSIESLGADGAAVIRAVLCLRASTPDQKVRESWTTLRLRLRPEGATWKITGQELVDGRTVIGRRRGFTDVTRESGITFESGHNPMLNDPEWFPKKFEIMKYATAGVAAADYDNDGWCDIFFCDGANPRLYRNKHDGTFEDVTTAAGLPHNLNAVHVALLADLDNDGDRELFLGRSTGTCYLFRNNGDGTFTDVTQAANVGGLWVATASAVDYDNDGKVDLYLGRYLDPRNNLPATIFYTRNGEGNSLLHNDGGLRFRDVTASAGIRDGGLTLGLCWGDYDRDGDQDVCVANAFGRSALFRNNGNGTFTDVAGACGATYLGYGTSASFADVDNDGDLDIYIAGVHTGQRWFGNAVTLQHYLLTAIQEGTIFADYPLYRELLGQVGNDWANLGERMLRGNALLLNDGDGTFSDVTEQSGANPHGWYWGCQIADFDHDGRQDIFAANGWITGKSHDDHGLPFVRSSVTQIRQYQSGQYYQDSFRGERSWNGYERKVLLRNEGIGPDGILRFANVAMAVGADDIKDGRGVACGDFDNDGDLDIVMNTNPGDSGHTSAPPVLLRNDVGQRRNWLAVELVGTQCSREAIGAEVHIRCAGSPGTEPFRAMRHVAVGSGYASQNSGRLHFGLGDDHPVVSSLTVRWPGGRSEQTFENVQANRWVKIQEGGGIEAFDPRHPAPSDAKRNSTAPSRGAR
jgi:hypothetical protein